MVDVTMVINDDGISEQTIDCIVSELTNVYKIHKLVGRFTVKNDIGVKDRNISIGRGHSSKLVQAHKKQISKE
jgi:hypothetical protein